LVVSVNYGRNGFIKSIPGARSQGRRQGAGGIVEEGGKGKFLLPAIDVKILKNGDFIASVHTWHNQMSNVFKVLLRPVLKKLN
jgi:hypothetical protein